MDDLKAIHDELKSHALNDSRDFERINSRIDNFEKKLLDPEYGILPEMRTRGEQILKHAEYTNGKVANLSAWRYAMTGGLAVITMLIIPILVALITRGSL